MGIYAGPRPKTIDEVLLEEHQSAMREWDEEFRRPIDKLCDSCMPEGYLALLAEEQAESIKHGGGVTGKCGPHWCVKCGGAR
jgi:hypothetical protein